MHGDLRVEVLARRLHWYNPDIKCDLGYRIKLKKPAPGIILTRISFNNRRLNYPCFQKLLDIQPDSCRVRFVIIDENKFRFRPLLLLHNLCFLCLLFLTFSCLHNQRNGVAPNCNWHTYRMPLFFYLIEHRCRGRQIIFLQYLFDDPFFIHRGPLEDTVTRGYPSQPARLNIDKFFWAKQGKSRCKVTKEN